ncbi:endonuclease domain-containing protein [Streptomyces sp. NPDC003863]
MLGSQESKRCVRCGEEKPRTSFAIKRSNLDGLQRECRDCMSEYHRERQISRGRRVRPRVEVPDGHKYCQRCGVIKPHSEWHRNATASDGLSTRCKACRAIEGRAGHLKRQYGITEAERDQMIADQGGVCVICQEGPAEHVDHDHRTGKVRGVLCFSCNAALGQFKDRPDVIRRAAAYVEGNLWNPTLAAQGVCRRPS